MLYGARRTSCDEVFDGRDRLARILYLLSAQCQLVSCGMVRPTDIYSLFEFHVYLSRSILLACGLQLVFIHPLLYSVLIHLKYVFLSK